MELERAQKEFNVRYYQWALKDWEREIEHDFPFLRTFKGGSAWRALDMMSKMDDGLQRFFAHALAKRFHQEAVQVLGERITPEEKRLCRQYCDRIDSSPAELLLHERELVGERGIYADGKLLRRCLRAELRQLNLEKAESASTLWRYRTGIDRWDILTEVQTTGSYAQVVYSHDIVLARERERVVLDGGQVVTKYITLKKFISLQSWLGISSQSEWCDLLDSDVPQVARAMVAACAHFLSAAPQLLSGL